MEPLLPQIETGRSGVPIQAISIVQIEMGAGIAASPHCAERRICRSSGPSPRGPIPKVLAHQLRRRFPSDNSLRRGDRLSTWLRFPKARFPFDYRCLAKPKPPDVPRPFLGRPLLRLALLLPSEDFRNRVALEEDQLFRRLFPTGATNLRRVSHCLSAEIGPSVTLRSLLSLAGLPVEAGTSVPITF